MKLKKQITDLSNTIQALAPIVINAIKSGQLFSPQCELTEAAPDILCEYDVEIPMSEGFCLTANIYRSKQAAEQNEPLPVVMCAHPYDNHITPALGKTPFGGYPLGKSNSMSYGEKVLAFTCNVYACYSGVQIGQAQ